jgi:hypothetical protein
MHGRHLSIDQLASFFGGDCSPELYQEILGHLQTCTSYCRKISDAQIKEDRVRREKREVASALARLGIGFRPNSS